MRATYPFLDGCFLSPVIFPNAAAPTTPDTSANTELLEQAILKNKVFVLLGCHYVYGHADLRLRWIVRLHKILHTLGHRRFAAPLLRHVQKTVPMILRRSSGAPRPA